MSADFNTDVSYIVPHFNFPFQPTADMALLDAAQHGDIDECQRQIDRGADVTYDNFHAFRMAMINGHTPIGRLLIKAGIKVDTVETLFLKDGKDLSRPATDATLLNRASEHGYADTVELLLETGNYTSRQLYSALVLAQRGKIQTPGSFGACRVTPEDGHANVMWLIGARQDKLSAAEASP